jgi:hypothetical protein
MKGPSILPTNLHFSRSSEKMRDWPSNFLRVYGFEGSVPRQLSASVLKKKAVNLRV